MFSAEQLTTTLETGIGGAAVEVTDLTGTSDHFKARIVADAFEGKSLIERHKMVYAVLGEAVGGAIHALSLETYTPEQWKARQAG